MKTNLLSNSFFIPEKQKLSSVITLFIMTLFIGNLTFSQTNVTTTTGGKTNYIPKFTGSSNIENSSIFNIDGKIGIGTIIPTETLDVNGFIKSQNFKASSVNTFVGKGAGKYNSSGQNNTFLGNFAGYNLTNGINNTFIGRNSGFSNNSSNNVFVGVGVGYNNIDGTNNIFIGMRSGYNSTGSNNLFLGFDAGYDATGSNNIFLGYNAGYSETGSNKLYIENSSSTTPLIYGDFTSDRIGINNSSPLYTLDVNGKINSTNFHATSTLISIADVVTSTYQNGLNVFIGSHSGSSVGASGAVNTFIGHYSGEFTTTGTGNTFMGTFSGNRNTTGDNNTFIGNMAGIYHEDGNENTFLGSASGYTNLNGSNNTFLGYQSGYKSTGSSNIFIGHKAGYEEKGSNKLYIENSSDSIPLIYGDFELDRLGINTNNPSVALDVEGDIECTTLWETSDERFKTNINPISDALSTISNISGKSYELKNKKSSNKLNYGFIAQELLTVLPDLVKQDQEGYYAVNYNGMIPFLVQAIKELQGIIENSQTEIEELKAALGQNTNSTSSQTNTTNDKAKLYQNNPNPFNQQTEIHYYLSNEVSTATMLIFDINGKLIKSYELTNRGNDKVIIYGNVLEPGMYIYSLVADNMLIDTKKMILVQ